MPLQSHIQYEIILWGSMYAKSNFNKIQRLQNECVKLITNNKNIGEAFRQTN